MLSLNHQFVRFLLVGVINTIFGYSIFLLFLTLGCHYSIAILLTTVFGVLFNFKTIGKLVFNNHNNLLIFKFILVYAVLYILNVSFLGLCKAHAMDVRIGEAIGVVPFALLSYWFNKVFVFPATASALKQQMD